MLGVIRCVNDRRRFFFSLPRCVLCDTSRAPSNRHIRQDPKRCVFRNHAPEAYNSGAVVRMCPSAEKLPVAVVIMNHIKNGALTSEDVLATQAQRPLRLFEWPVAIEGVCMPCMMLSGQAERRARRRLKEAL